jgi:hypothetical protein
MNITTLSLAFNLSLGRLMVKRESVNSLKLLIPMNHGKSGHGGTEKRDAGAEQAANVDSAQIRAAEGDAGHPRCDGAVGALHVSGGQRASVHLLSKN